VPAKALLVASRHTICINREIERALLLTVEKPAHKLPGQLLHEVRKQIRTIIHQATTVRATRTVTVSTHAADTACLAVASAARARIIVSGDRHLLDLTAQQLRRHGLPYVRIMSPRDFVDEFLLP
jgi:predicted nucleic acid-binding protein